jgi:hypothetical protein
VAEIHSFKVKISSPIEIAVFTNEDGAASLGLKALRPFCLLIIVG